MTDYVGNLLVIALIYAVLSSTLTVLIGQGGLLSVAHAMFFGVGGYATALLTTKTSWNWQLAIVAAILLSAALAVAVAAISLRVHEDYLVIASFGLQTIGTSLLTNLGGLTGGVSGVPGIPLPSVFGWTPGTVFGFVWLAAGTAIVCIGAIVAVSRSAFGRVLRACRDDPVAAAALGKRSALYKISIFAITTGLAALAGGIYALYRGFVSPADFTVDLSILVLTMVVIGGLGKISGAVLGAVLVVILPEAIRRFDLPASLVGPVEQIIYGVALVIVVVIRPQGLVSAWLPGGARKLRPSRREGRT